MRICFGHLGPLYATFATIDNGKNKRKEIQTFKRKTERKGCSVQRGSRHTTPEEQQSILLSLIYWKSSPQPLKKNKRKQKPHPNIHLPSISQWRTVNRVGYNKPEKHKTLRLPITATLHKRIQNPRPTIHLRSFHNDELETRRVIKSL